MPIVRSRRHWIRIWRGGAWAWAREYDYVTAYRGIEKPSMNGKGNPYGFGVARLKEQLGNDRGTRSCGALTVANWLSLMVLYNLAKDAEIVELKSRLSHTGRLMPSDLPPRMKMQRKCRGEDPINGEGEPHL